MKAYIASGSKCDKYTMKETEPGGAWCEGEINIKNSLERDRSGGLVVHYCPDGHIEGGIINYTDGDVSRVEIKNRDALPALESRACLKEIPNPYFGKKKPIATY